MRRLSVDHLSLTWMPMLLGQSSDSALCFRVIPTDRLVATKIMNTTVDHYSRFKVAYAIANLILLETSKEKLGCFYSNNPPENRYSD